MCKSVEKRKNNVKMDAVVLHSDIARLVLGKCSAAGAALRIQITISLLFARLFEKTKVGKYIAAIL